MKREGETTMNGFLKTCARMVGMAALAVAGASGCSGNSTTPPTAGEGELEIFSWWTSGANLAGLNYDIAQFNAKWPNIKVINSGTQGGGGAAARQALAQRMAQNLPPDLFQAHSGRDLTGSWIQPPGVPSNSQNRLEDLHALFIDEGWDKVIRSEVLESAGYQGGIYALPLGIHKGNNVFYNKALFDQNGIAPPTTLAELHAAATALQAKGIVPIAMGLRDQFSITMFFEDVFLSKAGPDFVRDYWAGKKAPDDPLFVASVNELKSFFPFVNTDASTLSYGDASKKLNDASAGMMIMGDWLKGLLQMNGLVLGTGFDSFSFPGTQGSFIAVIDVFALPKGLRHRDNAIEYLRTVGTREVASGFCKVKNCIPPRTDFDTTGYDSIALRTIVEYQVGQFVPSMGNGLAANAQYMNDFTAGLVAFFGDQDTTKFVQLATAIYPELAP